MKRILYVAALLCAFDFAVFGQGSAPLKVREVDGSPSKSGITTIVVSNGSLTISGTTATIVTGGGGGGTPGGADTQVQYNNAGAFGGVAGFTFNGTSTITLGVAGASVGAVAFKNATSGTVTLQPVTGALGTVTLSLPAGTDTLVGKATTDTFTNKTIAASSNVLGGVTMTLGSDADGDMYYRASNVLTRLPKGTALQVLRMNAGATAPEWAAAAGGGITIGTTTITSGTDTRILYNNAGVLGEYTLTGTGTTVAMSAGPTFTGTLTTASLVSTPISPSQITTSVNDYAGATGFINRLDSDADDNIVSGMAAGTAGQLAYDINIGSFDLIYTHQSGNSSAANRFDIPGDLSLVLHPGDTVARIYDGTTQRWRILSNPYAFAPRTTTGTGTDSGLVFQANSLTSGTGASFTSTSLSSGNLVSIAASGTAAASNTKTALNVSTSGANGTSSQTTYGARFANTSTGTSSTNYAASFTASGGSNNYAIQLAAGRIVGDTTTPYLELSNSNGSFLAYGTNYFFAGGALGVAISASLVTQWTSAGLNLAPAGQYSWAASGSAANAADTYLIRKGAANPALGQADAASPVAQTLSVQNVVGGTTNTAGATWKLIGSLGTSQGAPGRIHLTGGAMIAASGTTQQTAVDRHIVGATKVLTNNSATTITNVTVATETNAAGVIDYAVEVTDGTDVQYEVGSVAYGVTNKGGVFSGNTATKFGNHQNATSGTLTVTFAISGANPALLSVNANSSLTPSTGYPRITYTLRNLTQQAVAVQ